MAEFLTMEDAESKFGKKGRTNAGLTLGIIGTALAALGNNGGGCGCGNNGILVDSSEETMALVALCNKQNRLKR